MVKIEHSKADLTQFATDHYTALRQRPYEIEVKLREFARDAGTHAPTQHAVFAQLLATNLKTLITGWPDELEQIKPSLTRAFKNVLKILPSPSTPANIKKTKADYKIALQKVFDYKKFTNTYSGYGAYAFTKKLGVNVCPYCNRQYTFTLDNKTGKTRPELDHFLDKASHPYFGLSFFNLVPSCHICNANLKGSKKFTNTQYLNPYTTCFNDILNFRIGVKTEDFINGKVGSFTIKQEPAIGADKKIVAKAKRNAEIFQHSELYNNHQDLVIELLQKAYYYTPSRRKELAALQAAGTGNLLFKDEAEVNRFITGTYTEAVEIGKRPMSKLVRDIGKELGLL